MPQSSAIARVRVAGVAHPVGLTGTTGALVIFPLTMISPSRTDVASVSSAVGPAAEIPGTVDIWVFPITTTTMGREMVMSGFSVMMLII
jgi:hypothetical protein